MKLKIKSKYNMKYVALSLMMLVGLSFNANGQTEGEVMFTGFDADVDDGISFVALVDIPDNTNIHFNDNEWNELPIGGGGAFLSATETEMTWQNSTGGVITAGTVITITALNTTPTPNIGTITAGTISINNSGETVYMFLGTDRFTPTTFLSAITSNGFSLANGSLVNTGLTAGVNAISITGNEDVMIYTNNTNCNGTIAECAIVISTAANWVTEDGGGDQSTNGIYPDFPADLCDVAGTLFFPSQYYYSLVTGNWDANTSWSLTSDGSSGALPAGIFPRRTDNVNIRSGHTITVNAANDNMSCGVSPDGLNRTNVGTFASSNVRMFYHTGDIIVDVGATLSVTLRSMYEGSTYVNGTFSTTADIVNLGHFELTSAAILSCGDDLILTGNSFTVLDNSSTSTDDLYMDNTDALLCGNGILNVGNGGPNPEIQYLNGATDAQICASITITCTINCGGFVPPANPGNFSLGVTGPGGIGATDGTSELVLWLDANTIVQTTGTNLATWTDQSGYGNTATSPGGSEPVFNTNQINGFPAVQFTRANNDFMQITHDASLAPATISIFVMGNLEAASGSSTSYISKLRVGSNPPDGYALMRNGAGEQTRLLIDAVANQVIGTTTYGTYEITTGIYDNPGLELWANETSQGTDTYAGPITSHTTDMYLGATVNPAGTAPARFLEGDIGETIIFNRDVSLAERIIISNYLSAKYNRVLTNNDVYEMDDGANGDFDHEVAGIGQATDGSFKKDAQGTSLVRINLASDLDNNEYLMWGHDNSDINTVNIVDVDGAIIEARLERVWRASINDNSGAPVDVGTVRLTFDVSNLPPTILGSDMRLLITRNDALFADNDVTPQTGLYNVDNMFVTFSNVSLVDGDYFTLGTIDNTNSPLPIDLLSFDVANVNGKVDIIWRTASEQDNDFFTIERSNGVGEWQILGTVEGAGKSSEELQYQFWDRTPLLNSNYYRLKQTDFDGTSTYSDIKLVVMDAIDLISVYPNPFSQTFALYGNINSEDTQVIIYNILGKRMPIIIENQGDHLLIKANNLVNGVYLVRVIKDQSARTFRIIKH